MGKGGVAFGDRLEGSLVDKWREHYINYAHLRKIVEKLEANIDQVDGADAAGGAHASQSREPATFAMNSPENGGQDHPTAPSGGVGKNARIAVSAARIDQLGCHCFGWCCEMLRQIFVFVSNRPFGVSSTNDGGLKGYSGGNTMRPW